jgi:hypothetical protein
MKALITAFHDIKYVVSAAGVLIAFLFDKNLGPAEDDLPMRFKIILVAPVVVAVYYAQRVRAEQRPDFVPYIFGLLIVAIMIYMSLWLLFGYKKVVAVPKKWWRPWAAAYTYKDTRVMGGALRQDTKQVIDRERISVQEYFEGTAYNQDRVWTPSSRALLQVILVLTYVAVALFYTGTLALTLM